MNYIYGLQMVETQELNFEQKSAKYIYWYLHIIANMLTKEQYVQGIHIHEMKLQGKERDRENLESCLALSKEG